MRLVAARGVSRAFAASIAVASALAPIGCGKHEAGRTATSCDEAARRAVDALVKRTHDRLAGAKLAEDARASLDERVAKLDALAPRLRAVFANRCTDDRWPPDVIECHARVSTMDELRACRAHLTHDQQANVQHDELELLAAAQGLPGFGAAPPASSPEVARLEQEVRRLGGELADAQRDLESARDDEERANARAEVQRWESELEAANAALSRARENAVPTLPAP